MVRVVENFNASCHVTMPLSLVIRVCKYTMGALYLTVGYGKSFAY